jgi:hypothetical protein
VHGNRTTAENTEKTAIPLEGEAFSEAVCPSQPPVDPTLAYIVAAWPTLPGDVKAGLVAMADGAKALKVLSPKG